VNVKNHRTLKLCSDTIDCRGSHQDTELSAGSYSVKMAEIHSLHATTHKYPKKPPVLVVGIDVDPSLKNCDPKQTVEM